MRVQNTLKICEIFPSIQGEGLRQGEPTLFIRLTGCNLKCSFCDTKYAWNRGEELTVQQILKRIREIHADYPAEWICLTGGEPMNQELGFLVTALKKARFMIQIETNATLYQRLDLDWITISPKPEKYSIRKEFLKEAREVKLIATKSLEWKTFRYLLQMFSAQTPFLLQPQSVQKWSIKKSLDLLHASLEEGYKNIRLSIQIHKCLGIR